MPKRKKPVYELMTREQVEELVEKSAQFKEIDRFAKTQFVVRAFVGNQEEWRAAAEIEGAHSLSEWVRGVLSREARKVLKDHTQRSGTIMKPTNWQKRQPAEVREKLRVMGDVVKPSVESFEDYVESKRKEYSK